LRWRGLRYQHRDRNRNRLNVWRRPQHPVQPDVSIGDLCDLGCACSALLHVENGGAAATIITGFPMLRASWPMLNGLPTVPSACRVGILAGVTSSFSGVHPRRKKTEPRALSRRRKSSEDTTCGYPLCTTDDRSGPARMAADLQTIACLLWISRPNRSGPVAGHVSSSPKKLTPIQLCAALLGLPKSPAAETP